MNHKLPEGYFDGPVTEECAREVVDMINTYWRWLNGGDFTNFDDFSVEWQMEGFNRDSDARIVLSPQGKVVGYADLYDIAAPHVRLDTLAAVHPDYMGSGIGSFLLEWLIERARGSLHKAPEGARVVIMQGINSNNQAAGQLFTQFGFSVARHSYRMQIDFDQPPAAPVTPEGIVIRPIQAGEERAMLWAAQDSFRDHWGFVDRSFDEYYQQHMYFANNDPYHDPTLWFVAMDGQEVAGVALCLARIEEDPDLGYVNILGVRRPWRKRGIGQALLQHAFCEFYRRGKPRVGLGVDASSLTGATRLYEKAGMHVVRQYTNYELEIRSGVDLATKTLEH